MTVNGHSFQIYAAPTREPEVIALAILADTMASAQAGIFAVIDDLDEHGGAAQFDNPAHGAGGRWISTGRALVFGGSEQCCARLALLSVGQESAAS